MLSHLPPWINGQPSHPHSKIISGSHVLTSLNYLAMTAEPSYSYLILILVKNHPISRSPREVVNGSLAARLKGENSNTGTTQ